MLQLNGVTKYFSGLMALSDVSFELQRGAIKGLIGPNGAGKTTLFNVITGVFAPTKGKIIFSGIDITSKKPEQIVQLEVSRTFQQPHLYKTLTVLENVMLGRHWRTKAQFLSCGFKLPWAKREEKAMQEQCMAYLDLFNLKEKKDSIARKLPMGEQRTLEVARALAMEPKLLLLDEPTAGLNEYETDRFRDLIYKIRDMGTTVLVIEHNMKFIMGICDGIVVLSFGVKIAEGSPEEIQSSPKVIEAYLGKGRQYDRS